MPEGAGRDFHLLVSVGMKAAISPTRCPSSVIIGLSSKLYEARTYMDILGIYRGPTYDVLYEGLVPLGGRGRFRV